MNDYFCTRKLKKMSENTRTYYYNYYRLKPGGGVLC